MPHSNVAKVFILSVYIIGLINSANELERVKKRIKHLETRLNTESAFRDEDIAEIRERLDDIDNVLNATVAERKHIYPLKTVTNHLDYETVDVLKGDLTRIRTAFREEKYETKRIRREIPKIENKLSSINKSVENYCKVAIDKTDLLLSNFESFEKFVKDNVLAFKHEREILEDIAERQRLNAENEKNMSKQIKNLEKLVTNLNLLHLGSSCLQVKDMGNRESGIYKLRHGPEVYCDQTTDGGGWIVFQRRLNGNIDFYRTWAEYKRGFGDLNGEFWLGNDHLNLLTADGKRQLRIDMEDFDGNSAYALYNKFKIYPEKEYYKLEVSGYSGTAGNSLEYHNGMMFSTFDSDHDKHAGNCAVSWHGAWWYKSCHHTNLNGRYYNIPGKIDPNGISWSKWKNKHYSLKQVEMKFR